MADFKIKSAAGTGNKTLIQGQDQSGSNYAIEIGDAGALKLGTITSATFPAGHIVQTSMASANTAAHSDAYTSSTLGLVERGSNIYDWKGTITGVTAGNKILISMCFGWYFQKAGNDVAGGGNGIYHSTATDGSGTSIIYEESANQHYIHLSGSTNQTYVLAGVKTITAIHTSPSAGSNTYYLGIKSYSSGNAYVYSQSGQAPFTYVLQEIQQ